MGNYTVFTDKDNNELRAYINDNNEAFIHVGDLSDCFTSSYICLEKDDLKDLINVLNTMLNNME